MRFLEVPLIVCLLCLHATAQTMNMVEACTGHSDAVVRIDLPNATAASGFIAHPDGWILTTDHAVRRPGTRQDYWRTVAVRLYDGTTELAEVIHPQQDRHKAELFVRDIAVLKIARTGLPVLTLGSGRGIPVGSPLAIIGFPISAMTIAKTVPKFCISARVAAKDTHTDGTIDIDTIYFEGVSVKGLSGSPLISPDGLVVGILSRKLTGIDGELFSIKRDIVSMGPFRIKIEGRPGAVDLTETLRKIIDILDQQLANGMGSGTGIEDAAIALRRAQREYKPKK